MEIQMQREAANAGLGDGQRILLKPMGDQVRKGMYGGADSIASEPVSIFRIQHL